jgi:hypothetical protein
MAKRPQGLLNSGGSLPRALGCRGGLLREKRGGGGSPIDAKTPGLKRPSKALNT